MKSSSTGRGTATPDDRSADAAFAEFRRSGEPAAMAELFDRAAPGLLLFARRLSRGDAARAEDLLQQTFLRAIERADTFEAGAPVMPWLTAILANEARATHRSASRREAREAEVAGSRARIEGEATAPDREAEARELREAFEEALEQLPDALRHAVELRLLHGLPPRTIAASLGVPVETVRTRIKRGRALLQELLPSGLGLGAALAVVAGSGVETARAATLSAAGGAAGTAAGASLAWATAAGLATSKAVLGAVAVLVTLLTVAAALRPVERGTPTSLPAHDAQAAPDAVAPVALAAPTLAGERAAVAPAQVEAADPEEPGTLDLQLDLLPNVTSLTIKASAQPVTAEGFEDPVGPGRVVGVVGGAWTGRIWLESAGDGRFVLRNVRPGVELEFREGFNEFYPALEPPLGPRPSDDFDVEARSPFLASQVVCLEPGERRSLAVGRLGAPEVTFEARDQWGHPVAGVLLHLSRLGDTSSERFHRGHYPDECCDLELGESGLLRKRLALGRYEVTMRAPDGRVARRAEVPVDASMTISLVLEPVAETVVVLRNEVELSSVTGWAEHLPILAGGRVFPVESELDPGTYVYQGLPDKELSLELPILGLLPREIQAGAVNELEVPETGSVRFELEAPPGWVSFEVEHVESGARLVRNWPGNRGVLTRDLTPFRVGTYTASLLVTDEEAPTWRAKPVGTVEFEVRPGRRTKVRLVHP